MAKKIKLTRPELKKHRDALARFERYLPMLKLKQQQLQLTMREITEARRAADKKVASAQQTFDQYKIVLQDVSSVNVHALATCEKVSTTQKNIAGVNLPIFEGITFPPVNYSLFSTPPWVDRALGDLRKVNEFKVKLDILDQQHELLNKELTKIVQRVNLFEKVMIPFCREAIRQIRIRLGDEMASAVGRAKIAKTKLAQTIHKGQQDEEKSLAPVADRQRGDEV